MTGLDDIVGWRTVATHGQPRHPEDYPVLVRASDGTHVRHHKGPLPASGWIPLAELDALPDAPEPPKTVTIEVSADDVRYLMSQQWHEGIPVGRLAAAIVAALEANEADS